MMNSCRLFERVFTVMCAAEVLWENTVGRRDTVRASLTSLLMVAVMPHASPSTLIRRCKDNGTDVYWLMDRSTVVRLV